MEKIKIFFLILFFGILICPCFGEGVILFQDNFSSGSTAGWEFLENLSNWSIVNGVLDNGGAGYSGNVEAAVFSGITTPRNFRLEADIYGYTGNPSNYNHIGFIWGIPVNTGVPITTYNATYLRTHSQHVTNFSMVDGSGWSTEHIINTPGAVAGILHHLKIEVNYDTRTMTTTLNSFSQTFTGVDFDAINRNSGGKIGLISWQDHQYYDNVVLTDLSVPEPTSLVFLLSGLIAYFLKQK